jgi:hypothetical protein
MPPLMSLPRGLSRHAQGSGDRWPAEAPIFESADFGVDLSVDAGALLD